jgi:serine/threonine protein kinase/formylglycine-generating enzyme required for sulfatase activity
MARVTPFWSPPSEFDEYRLLRPLGHGAMGQVWLSHDLLLDRRVAIKFIGVRTDDAHVRVRFLNEARAVARLSHPNVVTVHRVGSLDGQPYMVSEWVEGTSLDQLPKPVDAGVLLRLAIDLARGLAAAHRAGILHRDVKPANAIVALEGTAKLLDFGLAKLGQHSPTSAVGTQPPRGPAGDPLETFDAAPPLLPRSPTNHPRHALTHEGAILGTPLYLAPEVWLGSPATPQTDVYALGALLYELSAGLPPVRFLGEGRPHELIGQFDARPLREVAPATEAPFAAVVDRCLHRDPGSRYANGDQLREALERLLTERVRRPQAENPYRGLAAFEADHESVFFGRDSEAREACDRLRGGGLVVVAGESGVGKSSLCRAALLPRVGAGALGDGRSWRSATLLPGRDPLRSLAVACSSSLGLDVEQLLSKLSDEPRSLGREVRLALTSRAEHRSAPALLVFVDQLEEWVTFADFKQSAAAALALASLSEAGPMVRVLASARTDLLSALSTLPGVGPLLSSSLFLLGPVRPEDLRLVIEGPAQAMGVHFESTELVDSLVEFASHGGALPLLQFALSRLWDSRGSDSVLTRRALVAMGGVEGALASHADAVIASMPASQREAARPLLTSLVASGDRRRRRAQHELATSSVALEALGTLARARLVAARDSAEGTTWELAHETLLRAWPMLSAWLRDDAGRRAWRERLAAAVEVWRGLERSPEALWGARQLTEFDSAEARASTPDEALFLNAARRRVRRLRFRAPAALAVVLLAAASTWGGAQWVERSALEARVRVHFGAAERHAAAAEDLGRRFSAARDDAFRFFDRGDFSTGEASWSEALALQKRWADELERAQAELEGAQFLLPSHPELAPRLLGVVERRLAQSDATGQEPNLEAELRRLESLGAGEEVRAQLQQPATVRLKVDPAGARVVVAQYENVDGHARLQPEREVNAAQPIELGPGSWRFSVAAQGFAPAHLPVLVRRGRAQTLAVALLPLNRVPPGYVHVPAGNSLVGAGGAESVRREFYEAAPLHEVRVETFLVGQTEVTFDQWLTYLDALDPQRRLVATPRLDANAGAADAARMSLVRTAEGWKLALLLDGRRQLVEGDWVSYPARELRGRQAWRRLPVVGVSPLDAVAYARWLDETGRVPGARLCTEYEWERAARGADGRTLTHGEVLEADEADTDQTYGRQDGAYGPDEVGSHPASQSPFGVDDLLGNVWEYVTPAERSQAKPWVSKGGSWQTSTLSARLPNHYVLNATYRQAETGVRVCVSVPSRE